MNNKYAFDLGFFNILGKLITSGVYQVLFYNDLRIEGTRDYFSS